LLAENLLQAFTADVVELHVHAPRLAAEPGPRPRTPGFARLQARGGNRVTNLRHEVVPLDDVGRHLLGLLDGERDRAALHEAMVRFVDERGMVVQHLGKVVADDAERRKLLAQGVEAHLTWLARAALLTA
jgi:methyltransferase-like protein